MIAQCSDIIIIELEINFIWYIVHWFGVLTAMLLLWTCVSITQKIKILH